MARLVDLLASRQRREARDSDIDANARASRRQWPAWHFVATHARVPVAVAAKRDRNLLEPAFHRPVEFDLDLADAGEVQAFAAADDPPRLGLAILEREAGVTAAPTEARIARFLTQLDASEECAKPAIEARDGVLQQVHVDTGVLGTILAHGLEFAVLVKRGDRRALLAVGVSSMFKRGVVHFAQALQRLSQRRALRTRWVESITVDAEHGADPRLQGEPGAWKNFGHGVPASC